jgi:hypothetical protein
MTRPGWKKWDKPEGDPWNRDWLDKRRVEDERLMENLRVKFDYMNLAGPVDPEPLPTLRTWDPLR